MEIRPEVKEITQAISSAANPPTLADEELIAVSPATRRIAFAYERFRNTLEPDEEDILRRKAIYRILRRRLAEGNPPNVMAEQLLQELIRARYVNSVSQVFAQRIAQRLIRAMQVWDHLDHNLATWFLRIVAVSIDRDMYPRVEEKSLVHVMYQDTYQRAVWLDDMIKEADRPVQMYIACHRALFEAEDFEIAYHYFTHHFPAWNAAEFTATDIEHLLRELPTFYKRIQIALHHSARERLFRLLRPIAVPYRVLRDIPSGDETWSSTDTLAQATREAIGKRIQKIRSRMNTRAWHSILFLLFTKSILAFVIELPYEVFLLKQFHLTALSINITFHPLLLLTLATTVRMPGTRNTERIVEDVQKIATGEGEMPTIVIQRARSYSAGTWSFFALVYAILFLCIFWLLFSILNALGFSLVAMFMFVIFLGLVSFLAIRIRRSVNEIQLLPRREGALSAIFSFLALPVLEFGRWLTQHISELNIALFLMDRVLEAPFKILIDIIEEWFVFVRDRREEIV